MNKDEEKRMSPTDRRISFLATAASDIYKELELMRSERNVLIHALRTIEVNEGLTHSGMLARNALAFIGRG